jgi:hypothetical protein
MSRSYNPKPWEDKSGVAFVNTGARTNGDRLQLRKAYSMPAEHSLVAQLHDEWISRKPYFIIVFVVGSIVILALSLLVYAALSS